MAEDDLLTPEDQERLALERFSYTIGQTISALPEKSDVTTDKGPRSIEVQRTVAYDGGTHETRERVVKLPRIHSSDVVIKTGDTTLFFIRYTPPHQRFLKSESSGAYYFTHDVGEELEIQRGDKTPVLHQGDLQKGLSVESLQPLSTLLAFAQKLEEEKKKRALAETGREVEEKAAKTRAEINNLI